MTKKIVIALVVIVVIAISAIVLRKQTQIITGSVVGPDISSPYLSVNGLKKEYRATNFTGATSTPCSFISPASTSTLLYAALQIRTASSTATTWHLATSTLMNATTSLLTNPISLASGVQGSMYYGGTTTDANSTVNGLDTLPPSSYVTWGFQGALGYSSSKLIGSCQAEFLVQ